MTKRRILLKIEIFVLIFAVLLSSVTFVMRYKQHPPTVYTFYKEPRNSLDVVFFGTSHMRCTVDPLQLYKDYGIVSHDLAQSGQEIFFTYESLKDTLRRQKPKVMVVDLFAFTCFYRVGEGCRHYSVDDLPLSSKCFFINSLIKAEVNLVDYYFPMYIYHSKWNSLRKDDFYFKQSIYSKKGNFAFNKFSCSKPDILPIEDRLDLPYETEKVLADMINLAEDKNVSLIFTVIPYDRRVMQNDIDIEGQQKLYNEISYRIKDKKNINYLNYFHILDEINFDFLSDLCDDNHLNFYGAQKITAHLGKYIKEHYDIPDRRLDPAYAKWNEDYKLYVQDIFARELNSLKEPAQYVQFIANKKEAAGNICMLIVKSLGGGKNSKYFQSLGLEITGNNYIAVLDNGKIAYQMSAQDVPLAHECKIGKLPVKLVSDANGTSSIKIDGIEQITKKSEMTVVIYDKLLKKVTSVRSL